MDALAPEPAERRQIKRAFRLVQSGWIPLILVKLGFLVAIIIGITSRWFFGVIFYGVALCCYLIVLHFARCPRCGKLWEEEDLDSLVCSTCRLDIRLGLRDEITP